MKKLKYVVSVLVMVSLIITNFGSVQTYASTQQEYASMLKEIGVFKGTSAGFELERAPTRLEGLVMLIRLLGKEDEALAEYGKQASVFKDVPDWGKAYANYAYANGLTTGTGSGKFGTTDLMDSKSYVTFILRALGYSDAAGDFTWAGAIDAAANYKVISGSIASSLKVEKLDRGNVAEISYLALKSTLRDSAITLIDKLITDGSISAEKAALIGLAIVPAGGDLLTVHFIDVGQADSILIIHGSDTMLIDAGENEDEAKVVGYIQDQGINQLDYVVGTHPHEDHIGGLDAVIRSFSIGMLLMPNITSTTDTFKDVIEACEQKSINLKNPSVGAVYKLGDANVTVLAPKSKQYEDTNNYSIVLKLVDGENSFLFTGDAEGVSEKEILDSGADIDVDLLKLGHHGSSSSTLTILDRVSPAYAVVSVGKGNIYGHPSDQVMKALQSEGVPVYRTDQSGTIVATSNGKSITFNTDSDNYTPGVGTEENVPAVPGTTVTPAASGLIVSSLDKTAEKVTIKNNSDHEINLAGYYIISVRGNQKYTFPSVNIKAGASITITSGTSAGDLTWGAGNVWNNSESDPAELYDQNGKLLFRFDN